MKIKNLIIMTILATVLLSGTFVSLVAADDTVSDPTTPPDSTTDPDQSAADLSDNSTVSQEDEVLYTVQENSTTVDDAQVPGEAEANLISTQTNIPDNTLLFSSIAVVLVIVVGSAIGVFFYRKKA
jgi:hypothetical protein